MAGWTFMDLAIEILKDHLIPHLCVQKNKKPPAGWELIEEVRKVANFEVYQMPIYVQ